MRHVPTFLMTATAGILSITAGAADYSHLPWDLRPYYEFSAENTSVRYASDNGEWDLTLTSAGEVASRVGMSVTLKDGTELTNLDWDMGTGSRSRATMPQGEGVHYLTTLPSKKGITVKHSFFVNTTRPFYLIEVQVTNTSDAPIEIAKISPVVFKPGSFAALSPQTTYTERPLALLGHWPIFAPDAAPLSLMLRDDAINFTLVMGLLPAGQGLSRPRLFQAAGGWQGDVVCEFNPPVTVQPGQSITADPVWMCFALPDIEQADILFAWTHAEEPRKYNSQDMLDAWVTVPALDDARSLYAAQKEWMALGVRHVLVPDGWEGRPGSLEGGTPRYPSDMGRVQDVIRKTGGIPGITVDPLLTDGTGDFTAVTDAGIRYVNLSDPKGYAYTVQHLQKVASWGYDFYVVAESEIPDPVLERFGMTRRQSEGLAIRVMEEVAGTKVVYPAPRGSLGNDEAAWSRADAASQRMYEFAMAIGPVRLATNDGANYAPAVLESIKNFDGPIEVVGTPSGSARRSLDGLFPRKTTEYSAKLPPAPRGKQLKEAQEELDAESGATGTEAPVAEPVAEPQPKPEKSGGFFSGIKKSIKGIVD